jgi:hypothetical protein
MQSADFPPKGMSR